ncbi:hypothetical protein CSOJ01_14431 [Colletotrichum sojae]|uniref:Beta-galactosidase trimerisation domain-containing protein n=1 Tax=Colletotrichum sojae TaxID=2175907 RepID=A0A8H6IQV7_9PEZI|nr:hypothetical protein CSOJ01_14431 [Colletotrichum sojae]
MNCDIAGDQFSEALSEFRGLYAAMQELQVAFDVLAQEHLLAMGKTGELKRYQVVVLPNLGKLGADEATSLYNWVHDGGHIITTGSSAIEDDEASQLRSLPFDRELEKNNDREQLFSTYFAPPQASSDPHVYNGPIVPLYGVYHTLQWKASSKGGYKMLSNAPFAPPEKAYGNLQTNERDYGAGDYGSGRGVSIPFAVGRGYRELGLGVFRDLYEGIQRDEGATKKSVCVEIAEQVEMTMNANSSRIAIHLINMSGARRQNFGSHVPILGGKIMISGGTVTARALKQDVSLELNNGVIMLPTLDLFEVIILVGIS